MSGASNRIEVLHGVNLDTLGRRDPAVYGTFTLPELERQIRGWAKEIGYEATCFQTNHEGEFIEYIHRMPALADGAIVNAGAWSHYSYAIRDALEVAALPTVELHISDVDSREDWRRISVFDGVVVEKVSGEGAEGYRRALGILQREIGA